MNDPLRPALRGSLWERIMYEARRCQACSTPGARLIRIEGLGRFCSYECAERAYADIIIGCSTCGYVHEAGDHLTPIISLTAREVPLAALARIMKAARS